MRTYLAALRDRAGIASLEAALTISLLLVGLVGGTADGGLVLMAWLRASRAEREAILYAWQNGAGSLSAIEDAASAAYGSPSPTVTASTACYCLPSATPWAHGGASAVSCGASCGAGDVLTEYLTVSVSANVALPLAAPGFAGSVIVAASGVARLQ